jgi:hypothetical protein
MSTHRAPRRSWLLAAGVVAVRPWLWGIALRSVGRLARPAWWRRTPFLPIPDRAYLRFRLETQYGAGGAPAPRDLATYLGWCRAHDQIVRRGLA